MSSFERQQVRANEHHPVSFGHRDETMFRHLSAGSRLGGRQGGGVDLGSQRFAESCPLNLSTPQRCPFGGACHTCPTRVQAKLTIGRPDDEYEREADQVAEQVMSMPEPRAQRVCSGCEDEELRRQPSGDEMDEEEALRRQPAEEEKEEEEIVEAKERPGRTPRVTPQLEARLGALREGGRPLPESAGRFFAQRFGRDFRDVHVHTETRAQALARSVHARAFTVGRDIVFGARQYAPETVAGRTLLAHELTHVLQQKGRSDVPRAAVQRRDRGLHNVPGAGQLVVQRQAGAVVQREEESQPPAQAGASFCSIAAKRQTLGTGFCVRGTTNVPDGTTVNFHYLPGLRTCDRGSLSSMPPFGSTVVALGRIYWNAPTNVASMIPGVGRMMGALAGSATCCTVVRPGTC